MTKARSWTVEEIRVLLRNRKPPDDELSRLLPGRTTDAIGTVRSGLHSYHRGLNISMLSLIMRDELDKSPGKYRCPKCSSKLRRPS